ncbi:molybdate ABC transporter permease subunit [Symbiobacterium thermophilum]|uniref:Molybdenum transport system permease n=1 Tax=Symbiobacterium thermophilum TaxID=2734 RepID=A0A1Y2T3E5_SYMTR|nr:molybdate ABC transporter permease subunit [Symbiobacterium thermophilum]MBY6275110.1 molybdate ABC transporter permease subunit [Symbiobacterium thermophilum]OTA40878.1 MAG: molybdenum ABC transporter permease subunit [Symbiobacterium thermophilum]
MSDLGAIDWFPVVLSLRVAFLATLSAALAGVPLAYGLARRRLPAPRLLSALTTLPLVLPPTVVGYYLLLLIGRQGPLGRLLEGMGIRLVFTWHAAVLAAAVVSFPLVVRSAQAAFESVDPALEAAARTLGRSELSIFFTVTAPLAWRGILAGAVLAFARAMGEFGATLMVAGNIPGRTQTLSVAIYDAVQSGQYGLANALVLLISLVSVGVLVVLTGFGEGRGR